MATAVAAADYVFNLGIQCPNCGHDNLDKNELAPCPTCRTTNCAYCWIDGACDSPCEPPELLIENGGE